MCQCGYELFDALIQEMILENETQMQTCSDNPGKQVTLKEKINRL